MGITLTEIVNRILKGVYVHPYEEKNFRYDWQIFKAVSEGVRPLIMEECPPVIKEIINDALLKDPEKRPTTQELIERFRKAQEVYKQNKATWDKLPKWTPPEKPPLRESDPLNPEDKRELEELKILANK